MKYIVLDDMLEKCPEWLLKAMKKNKKHVKFLHENRDDSQPLQSWEINKHCFRSIRYHHKKKHAPHLSSKQIKGKQVN
jgi:hypothetical protein